MRNFLRSFISCETMSCHRKLNSWNFFLQKNLENWSTTSFSIHSEFSWNITCLHYKKGSLTLKLHWEKNLFFHSSETKILTTQGRLTMRKIALKSSNSHIINCKIDGFFFKNIFLENFVGIIFFNFIAHCVIITRAPRG